MQRAVRAIGLCTIVLAMMSMSTGCTRKVWVMTPPDVDLTGYERIGLIEFSCNEPGLDSLATQQFQQAIHEAQSQVRVVELGDEQEVLRSVDHQRPSVEAMQAIVAKYDLDAIFMGDLELSRVAPKLGVSMSLISVSGSAEMQAVMSARLIEADGGATVWTSSSRSTISIARAAFDSNGIGSIGVTDPTRVYGDLVAGLATGITDDFRARYARRKPEDVPPHYVPTYPDGVEVYAPPRLSQAGP